MRKFILTTPYGDQYFIHDDDIIERADMPGQQFGQWRFLAVVQAEGSGWGFGKRAGITLADLANGRVPARYANGNPRFTGEDYDHGTMRVWGNTRCHGIGSVYWHPSYSPGVLAP